MARSMLVMAVLVARTASADEWRDGCPAGHRGDRHSDFRMGAVPDTTTTLTQNRLTMEALATYGASSRGAANHGTAHVLTHAHLEYPSRPRAVLDILAPSSNASGPWSWLEGPAIRLGARWNYHGDLDEEAFEHDARSVSGLRKSIAVQLLTAGSDQPPGVDNMRAASALPFESFLFSPVRTWGAELEYRLEQIGCQAAFVHFTQLLTTSPATRSGETVRTLHSIGTIAAGVMIDDHLSIVGQYGLSVLATGSREISIHHRLRVGSERTTSRYVLGAHLDLITRQQGITIGVYLGLNHNVGYP